VKLFQIEEPDGGPSDPDLPGAAIGIDASGAFAEVGFAVGGNAAILADREGFEASLPVPPPNSSIAAWQELFEGARLRAERALARPVTHAVVMLAGPAEAAIAAGAAEAGLTLLRLLAAEGKAPALAAACLAEDLAPRS
jgi:hypothetical protein